MIDASLSSSGCRANSPVLEPAQIRHSHPLAQDGAAPPLREEIIRIVTRQATNSETRSVLTPGRLDRTVLLALADLSALAGKDPAAHGSWRYVWEAYSAYRATLAYRAAHAVHTATDAIPDHGRCHALARLISETAKVETGATRTWGNGSRPARSHAFWARSVSATTCWPPCGANLTISA